MQLQKIKAFTLVELIIVITILAILRTIGFMSFQTYTGDTRDTKRKTDLGVIRKGLEIYQMKNQKLPDPDNYTNISSGGTLSLQGYAGTIILKTLRISEETQDLKDNKYYTYSVSTDKTKYQLLAMLEKQENLAYNQKYINQANAIDYTRRFPYTIGQKIGIYLSGTTNTPIQEGNSGAIINVTTGSDYRIITENSGTIISTPRTYSCQGTLITANATITNTGGLTSNTTYQNTNSSGKCYYTCTGGYSGNDCSSKVNIVDFFGDNSGKALYQFENNANDTSGNYNGTPNNLTYLSGKFGTGGNFNGSNTYIVTHFIIPAIQTYTFSARIKTSNTSSDMAILCDTASNGADNSGRGGLGFTGNKFYFNMGNNTSFWYDQSTYNSTSIRDNNWNNIILVINGTSQILYINGVQFANLTSSLNSGTIGARPYTIGRLGDYSGVSGYYFNGLIDQLRIFTKALSQSEVTQIYNEQ